MFKGAFPSSSIPLVFLMMIGVVACRGKDPDKEQPSNMKDFTAAWQQELAQSKMPRATDPLKTLWFKDDVLYSVDIKVFKDSDGNGIGDINGLISRLDYLKDLGIDVIWLAPFYPSPNEDDGYDITDFYGVDPRLGTIEDFNRLVDQIHQRNMKLIIDLVYNHTSISHPWFQASRHKTSPYHNWYVWADKKPENKNEKVVFEGMQQDLWSYDSTAGQYYYHRFYDYEPDLNMQDSAVLNELRKLMVYWLRKGINGFRVDAVTYLTEEPNEGNKKFKQQYDILTYMRSVLQHEDPNALLLGEATVPAKQNPDFFGEHGEKLNMIFNFYLNQHLFYAMAAEDARPAAEAIKTTGHPPLGCQWLIFMRNHDEMGMGRMSEDQKQKVFDAFAPQDNMRLYNRGVCRRLAPMFNNDPQRLRFAYNLMFSLPSAAVVRYGDELGMGDDLSLSERLAVRTPMQWNDSVNAGFSGARKVFRPIPDTGTYSYRRVNVAGEEKDSASLLLWMKKIINLRKTVPEITWGTWKVIESGSPAVLAIEHEWEGKRLLTLHNFSRNAVEFDLSLDGNVVSIVSLFDRSELKRSGNKFHLKLGGFGFEWMRLQ